MNKVKTLVRRSLASGTTAAITSALVASREASHNGASSIAPLNAVAHCIWPVEAMKEQRLSARLTGTGAFIHWGASVFWGTLFETLLLRRRAPPSRIIRMAAVTAATAYVVDYHVVPKRITPGFEAHMPRRSFLPVYIALGAGLALARLLDD
ncbi:hypothetical protein [Caballeronia insecticola]|uniref:hypothetical protein n=1 Tax=Caballeronia insecticola TaxID=758793 RepID=UPI000A05AE67|nr:hypothetical protein [Caballeronia insecticola]